MIVRLIIILFILVINTKSYANNIYVENFNELLQSGAQSSSGDTITIVNDLTSNTSIGNSFLTKDVYFEGQNHSINGGNNFGGFILNQGSNFNMIRMSNCKGQLYNGSYFAGAIFNNAGNTLIENSTFSNNYADAGGINFAVAGAVYNLSNGNVTINSTLFNNNYTHGASAQGGAIGNDTGKGTINITNSVFNSNYASSSAVSYGGAIANGNYATINITNSLFNNNYTAATSNDAYLYGGSIYNTGNMNIDNSYFYNNHIIGNNNSFSYGGAIHNNSNLTITNSIFNNNYITSDIDTSGGALYNYVDGNVTIENSVFENNSINAQNSRGGAIGNEGVITIIDSTFKNNTDINGPNDIYNNNIINFTGNGTTNILSGIRGSGNINKNGGGILNLGGNNSNYTGTFNLESGTVNVMANSEYFNANATNFSNNVNLNMQNGQIDNLNFGTTTLSGNANIYPDVNLSINTMDTIGASSLSGSGKIYVPDLAVYGIPKANFISIPFADSILKDSVVYDSRLIETPIYNYLSYYNSTDGDFVFTRRGFNAGILSAEIAAQTAGYLLQIDTFNNVFSNLDMVTTLDNYTKTAMKFYNKFAYTGENSFGFVNPAIPEQNCGIWFKPYTTFENIPLKNGPTVSNVGYGGLIGGESSLRDLKKGWKWLYGQYISYNGSHQAYEGIGIYNNGGLFGGIAAFYKDNFFSLWSANVGANSAKAHTHFDTSNFSMLNTGIAQKTGYNFSFFKKRLIIQPNIMSAYTFVNTFDFTNPSGVHINAKPLNVIHIEPQIKIIGNFKNMLQPYLAVSVAWNIMDNTKFMADDVYLPELSVKPYVKYGAGFQKRIGEKFTGFAQAYVTNGGRNGIGLQCGLRWSLGKTKPSNIDRTSTGIPELPKTKITLNNISS